MAVIYGVSIHRQAPAKMTVIKRPESQDARKQLDNILRHEFNAGRVVIKRYGGHWHVYTDRLSETEVLRAVAIVASSDAKRVKMTHTPAA